MSKPSFEVHQEEDAVASRSLVHIGLASLAIGVLGVVGGAALLALRVGAVKPSFAGAAGPAAAPREISHVEQTPIWRTSSGEDLRTEQHRELQAWGWADRDAGVARVPIDVAMDLVVRESR